MEELWNRQDLKPPPTNSGKANVKEIDVKLLFNVLENGVAFFKSQEHLNIEAALLSRTIYRIKMKFRSSKDLKALEKINRALKLYLRLEIWTVLRRFLDSVPKYYTPDETNLPTRHMLDFVLVRIQGLGKLLVRILDVCETSSALAQQRIRLGHFWKMGIIFYGMTARIFIITKNLIKYSCDLYSNLLPFRSKLSTIGNQWLPDGYIFPEKLGEWLNIDWLDLEAAAIEIADDDLPNISYFNLIDDSDDDIEISDEYVLVKDDALCKPFNRFLEKDTIEILDDSRIENFLEDVDIGEVISVSDVETPVTSRSILPDTDGANSEVIDVGEIMNVSEIQTPQAKLTKEDEVIDLLSIVKSTKAGKRKHRRNMNPTDLFQNNVPSKTLNTMFDASIKENLKSQINITNEVDLQTPKLQPHLNRENASFNAKTINVGHIFTQTSPKRKKLKTTKQIVNRHSVTPLVPRDITLRHSSPHIRTDHMKNLKRKHDKLNNDFNRNMKPSTSHKKGKKKKDRSNKNKIINIQGNNKQSRKKRKNKNL